MKVRIRDVAVLNAIRPLEVAAYLRAAGWTMESRPFGHPQWARWLKDNFEVTVPLTQNYADFAARLADVLAVLEVAENRSQLEILADLETTAADIVRVHLGGVDAGDGSIPILDGAKAFQEARDMFMAAACAVLDPRPFYPTRKPAYAIDYMSRVRLGQTERGSYVIRVISRVPPQMKVQENLFPNLPGEVTPPYERRVVTLLSHAVMETKSAAETAATIGDFAAFQEAVSSGVSANLCEAIYGLGGGGARGFDIGFSWARSRPLETGALVVSKVSFTPDVLPIIQEAARIFKATAPREQFELRGPVVKLDREPGQLIGKATVLGFVDEEPRKVIVELPGEDYHVAVTAHDNKQTVRCRGVLKREGRFLFLRGVSGIEIDADDESSVSSP